MADLEAATSLEPSDLATLRELGSAYVSAGALPAALAVTRRVAAIAEAGGEAQIAGEARVSGRAIALLLGAVDPVAAGSVGRGPVRSALAAAARRR